MNIKLAVTLLISSIIFCDAAVLEGKVIKVSDGDTIRLLTNNKQQHRIRLAHIDAPESKQAYGNKSRENLANYIAKQYVTVEYNEKDQYGRIVGVIYFKNKNINLLQVQDGYAWYYKHFSNEKKYQKAEEEARRSKKGLWKDKNPIAPWNFRRN